MSEIILKEYSELSLWQRIKLKYLMSKLFDRFELLALKAQKLQAETVFVSVNETCSVLLVQIAQLFNYYNSNEYSDYRVLQRSLDYLNHESTAPHTHGNGSAQVLLEHMLDYLDGYIIYLSAEKEA